MRFLLILALCATACAQKSSREVDFTGTWVLQSIDGPGAGEPGATLNVYVSRQLLVVEQSAGISIGKKKSKRRVDLKGKAYPNESLGGPTTTKAYREGDSMVIVEKLDPLRGVNDSETVRIETWSLSADGRSLKIKTEWQNMKICGPAKCETQSLDYEYTFEKQAPR